jgi:two-component system, NtrC family, sensor kinase
MDAKARILLVDDSPAYRRVIQTMLGPKYDFAQAETAEEALARVGPFQPDLVISDLIMPGIDGYELCRRLRAQPGLENVPIIMLTSKTGDESRITGLEVGADDYLFKPIRPRELNARVTSLLRLRRATLELEEANQSLKKAQAELIRAEKLASLGQLVAGIAHELNNPLNYIYGNTEFLSEYVKTFVDLLDRVGRDLDLSPAQQAQLSAWKEDKDLEFVRGDLAKLLVGVRLGAERAAEIVRGLRAFARVGSAADIGHVDLGETIDLALTILRHELRDRIRVHKDLGVVPRVRCDASRMSQVFVNLILNAIQAMKGEGDLFIRLSADDEVVRIAVRDTGCGIPAQVRGKVFDPFFTTKPVGQGTGLGLSISYGIVEQHGGRIEVESVEGHGATFTVILPRRGPPAGAQAQPPEGERVSG